MLENSPPPLTPLESDITALIIDAVNLHHLSPDQIQPQTPLTQGGLNLDSVDILEIVVAVEQKYKIKVKDAEVGKKYFTSIATIADFVQSHRGSPS